MKGNNTFEMNQATITAAVQMYLDAQFVEGARQQVQSVKTKGGNGYGGDLFVVELTEPEKPK